MKMSFAFFIAALFLGAALGGCTRKSAQETAPPAPLEGKALNEQGRRMYMGNCTACHNVDPKLDGPLGPALAGSSQDLIYLRVVEGKYPEGYKPKRTTHTMTALPHLKNEVPALHAYLNSL